MIEIFNYYIDRQYITENPFKGIKRKKKTLGRNIAFSKIQQEKIERYMLEHDRRFFYFTRFIYYGFIRPKELLSLKIKDIDLKGRSILISLDGAKGKRQENITINEKLAKIIEEMELGKYPKDFYIFSYDLQSGDKEWHRNRVSERHKEILKRLNLYNGQITLYSWKHTGVVNAYRAGADIKAIQRQCRHLDLNHTNIYLKSLGLEVNKTYLNIDY
jgi:integrase